jgi:uncharacterized protein YPO0396
LDAIILHERLAAAEGALLKLDERLDAANPAEAISAVDARISVLEEKLTQCLSELEKMAASSSETAIAAVAIAEAAADEAEARADEAEALAAVAAMETEPEPEPELELTEAEVLEVEPEPESAGAADPANSKSPNWLERLLVLR